MALNFLPRGPAPAGFSLDRRDHARRRGLQRKEWRLLIILPMLVVLMAVVIQTLLRLREAMPKGPGEPEIAEIRLEPMPAPRLQDAPSLPTPEAVTAVDALVGDLMQSRATIRHQEDLDPATLAWSLRLITQDRQAPPLPVSADAHDVVAGHLPAAAPVALDGILLDARIDGPWMRLILGMEEQQFVQILTPQDTPGLVVGNQVRVVGRHLGVAILPSGDQGDSALPLLAASIVRPLPKSTRGEDQDLQEFRTGFPTQLPVDLYDGVSDERNALERRPYYTLLGQSKLDRDDPQSLAAADQGNARADAIHRDPPTFRGQLFHVTGRVYRAWEDPLPARDQPYGITRVVRILLWNRDIGQVTEIEDGKPRFKTQILRLYELALATNQPLPERGDKIVATARFLKFRAIPVARDRLRDEANGMTRQSDKVYPFTFVGGDFTVIPPPSPYTFTWVSVLGAGIAATMVIFLIWVVRRDQQSQDRVPHQIRALRASRRRTPPPSIPSQP